MGTVTSADGTSIAFERLGSGPPVVLLPGALCTRGTLTALAESLSQHVTTFAVDRRGRGDSGDRATPPPYAVEREVEDVAAIISAAGGSAAVYGHSSGAGLALHAAAAGIGVERLVLHDAPYHQPGNEQSAVDWHVRLYQLLQQGLPGDAVAEFMLLVGMPPQLVADLRAGPGWPAMAAVGPSLAYDSAAMGDRTGGLVPDELLAEVTAPTLVMVGGEDHGFMIDVARALATALPDARLDHLVGARHDVGPEVVVPHLLPFLLA